MIFLNNDTYSVIIDSNENNFFKSIIQALLDFNELNPIEPLQMVLEVSNILYKIIYINKKICFNNILHIF